MEPRMYVVQEPAFLFRDRVRNIPTYLPTYRQPHGAPPHLANLPQGWLEIRTILKDRQESEERVVRDRVNVPVHPQYRCYS